jgi:hypothetical protein
MANKCKFGIGRLPFVYVGLVLVAVTLTLLPQGSRFFNPSKTIPLNLTRCSRASFHQVNFSDIPSFSPSHVPQAWLSKQPQLYDSTTLALCLADQTIWLLGDSTMSETAHDIVLLLSGQGGGSTLLLPPSHVV